jgi:hypothetical protein
MVIAALCGILLAGPPGLEPADAAPRTRIESGRLVYQLGETKFAFRLSKGPWKDLADGVYVSGTRLVSVATGRSVKYEDGIEAQSRAIGALVEAVETFCPKKGACRMNPEMWKRFERFAWLDAARGEFKVMLRAPAAKFSVARTGAGDSSAALKKGLEAKGRALPVEAARP